MDAFFLILLLITSIVGVVFIVERGLALRWRKVVPPEVETAVESFKGPGDISMLQQICQRHPSPLSRLLFLANEHRHWPKSENIETLQTQARHEIVKLERGLVILEIVVGIAPLLGLVGTIYGLILLFGGLGQASSENAQVAGGIALALRATLLGLLTAIPALIAWSYYNKKVESLSVELETLCDLFMRRLYRQPIAESAAVKTEKTVPVKVEKDVDVKAEKEVAAKVDKETGLKIEKEVAAKAEVAVKSEKAATSTVEKPSAPKTEKAVEKKS